MRQNIFISLKIARYILIAISIIFLVSGLIVTGFYLAKMIPPDYNWQGPLFLILGSVGFLTAYYGLRVPKLWTLIVLSLVYIPWTILGLLGDLKQGFWPLVIGEFVGLSVVLVTLIRIWEEIRLYNKNSST